MAPQRVQALLALEVETGKTATAGQRSRAHCSDGARKPDLGTSTRRLGTISETEDLRLAQDGAGLLAVGAGSEIPENILAALAEVRPESCAIHSRL